MLYDKARIYVQAGGGGNGCMSFRREAHVPKGGPDGGDGGHGGDVVLLCDDSYRDLQSFKRKAHYKADRGRHGEGALRHGADGDDLVVRVPPGTQVTVEETGEVHDLVVPGTRVVVARGGSGGKGNKKFAGSTRQAPRFAERGLDGYEVWLDLRLKLLADVGLVGLPNAGKSSMLGRMTRAAPKVANYPFTTLEPVLGTLDGDDRQLVLADIPGLIEGAAGGAGPRPRLPRARRAHAPARPRPGPRAAGRLATRRTNYATIERELAEYDERLARAAADPRAVEGRPRLARGGRDHRRGLARALRRRAARARGVGGGAGRHAGADHLSARPARPRRAGRRAAAPRARRSRSRSSRPASRHRGAWRSTARSARAPRAAAPAGTSRSSRSRRACGASSGDVASTA